MGGCILSSLLSLGGCGGIFQEPKFLPSQEHRFFVVGWDVGPFAHPDGWPKVEPRTLSELKSLCSEQVCFVYKGYITKGSQKISKEQLYKLSEDFANLLEVDTFKVKQHHSNVLTLDLRYSPNKQ